MEIERAGELDGWAGSGSDYDGKLLATMDLE
jgi:hypothetical protein